MGIKSSKGENRIDFKTIGLTMELMSYCSKSNNQIAVISVWLGIMTAKVSNGLTLLASLLGQQLFTKKSIRIVSLEWCFESNVKEMHYNVMYCFCELFANN